MSVKDTNRILVRENDRLHRELQAHKEHSRSLTRLANKWKEHAESIERENRPWMGCPEFKIVISQPSTLGDIEIMREWLNLYLRHCQSDPSI